MRSTWTDVVGSVTKAETRQTPPSDRFAPVPTKTPGARRCRVRVDDPISGRAVGLKVRRIAVASTGAHVS